MSRCDVSWITTIDAIGSSTAGASDFGSRKSRSAWRGRVASSTSFTLHDVDGTRLLGYDNAHGVPRAQEYDHRHRFRHDRELVAYEFRGADELLVDFFAAVERACAEEGSAFEFEAEEIELEAEEDDDAQVHD